MCRLSVDLRASGNPVDDLRAIKNCYSAIAQSLYEGSEVEPDNLGELLFLLEAFQEQCLEFLEFKSTATTGSYEKELTDICQSFSELGRDKAYIKYLAHVLNDSGQPLESFGVGELLSSIDLWEKHFESGLEVNHG